MRYLLAKIKETVTKKAHSFETMNYPDFPPNRICTICGEIQAQRFRNKTGPARSWWETKQTGDGSCGVDPVSDQGGM